MVHRSIAFLDAVADLGRGEGSRGASEPPFVAYLIIIHNLLVSAEDFCWYNCTPNKLVASDVSSSA